MKKDLAVMILKHHADKTGVYTFNHGYTANRYPSGHIFVYNANGNYASQVMVQRAISAINEYHAIACRATI
jgi:hypothetical protein